MVNSTLQDRESTTQQLVMSKRECDVPVEESQLRLKEERQLLEEDGQSNEGT